MNLCTHLLMGPKVSNKFPSRELSDTQEPSRYTGHGDPIRCSTSNTQNLLGLENGATLTSFVIVIPCQAGPSDTPPSITFPQTSSVHPGLEETKYTVVQVLGLSDPTSVFLPGKDEIKKSCMLLLSEKEGTRPSTGQAEPRPRLQSLQPP